MLNNWGIVMILFTLIFAYLTREKEDKKEKKNKESVLEVENCYYCGEPIKSLKDMKIIQSQGGLGALGSGGIMGALNLVVHNKKECFEGAWNGKRNFIPTIEEIDTSKRLAKVEEKEYN